MKATPVFHLNHLLMFFMLIGYNQSIPEPSPCPAIQFTIILLLYAFPQLARIKHRKGVWLTQQLRQRAFQEAYTHQYNAQNRLGGLMLSLLHGHAGRHKQVT